MNRIMWFIRKLIYGSTGMSRKECDRIIQKWGREGCAAPQEHRF